jgi:hypothetical protein
MPTRGELLVLLGPLADIMPRVFGLVTAVALTMFAAAYAGRAFRAGRVLGFLAAWLVGATALLSAWLGFVSLADYGRVGSRRFYLPAEPLSAAGIRLFLSDHAIHVAFGVMVGVLVCLILRVRRRQTDVSAEEMLTSSEVSPKCHRGPSMT